MIILLHPDAGPAERAALRERLLALGVAVEEVRLGERIALVRSTQSPSPAGGELPAESLARLPGVERVIPLTSRTPLAERLGSQGSHAVAVGPAVFGGGQIAIVAGPCTVEDPGALREVAALVARSGATALRGGVYKVRTSPHNFQGGGASALAELAAAAREVGLPFFTEISDPRHVAEVAAVADGLQIGARHMQNFPLLIEAGRSGKPVLLKRHMAADVEEWLLAAEYLLKAGNERVILCERGLRSSERHVRYLLDLGAVAWVRQRTGLPVIVDPSHAAGDWRLVASLARAAIAAGADGLIVEVHPRPEGTRCDAFQALPPSDFERLMADVAALAALDGRRLSLPGAVPVAGATAARSSANGRSAEALPG